MGEFVLLTNKWLEGGCYGTVLNSLNSMSVLVYFYLCVSCTFTDRPNMYEFIYFGRPVLDMEIFVVSNGNPSFAPGTPNMYEFI